MSKAKKHDEVNKVEIENELKEKERFSAESEKNNNKEKNNKTNDTEMSETKVDTEETAEEEITEPQKTDETIKKSEEIESLNNRLLRLQADYLNYKNRTEKEKHTTYGDAVTTVICDLLPVIDNLERAIAADMSETDNFKEGVVMVYNQLMKILDKKGLKEIDALHKSFDHNLHYGVAFEECEDYDDGIIIDVLQKGYTVNDKLLRPSMVRICRK